MHHKKFNAYRSLVSASLLSLAVGLVTAACESPAPSSQIAETQAATPVVAAVKADDANPKVSPPAGTPVDASIASSEIDFSDACIRNDCDARVPHRPLSTEEVNIISGEISPDHAIIRDHSFAITLPVIGQVEFVAEESKADHLYLSLRTGRNEYVALYESPQWNLQEVTAVAFKDIHEDGDGPDIIVIANYITGIGPTGAQSFSAPTILFNRGDDTFQQDIVVDHTLSQRGVSTVDDVIATARSEGLVRGRQYYEGF